MRVWLLAGVCTAAAVLVGCGSSGTTEPAPQATRPAPTPTPTSTVVPAGASCHQSLGGTVTFADVKHGVALRVTTAKANTVDHAFSSYAHGPANGHYLVVDVKLKNVSENAYRLDPTLFVFTTSSGRKLTVNSGNAPYSGASTVLDPTYLVAGGSEHGPLIYDTGQLHGRIVLSSAGKPACTWTV